MKYGDIKNSKDDAKELYLESGGNNCLRSGAGRVVLASRLNDVKLWNEKLRQWTRQKEVAIKAWMKMILE